MFHVIASGSCWITVGDADRTVLADAIEDERLALARQHQAIPTKSIRRVTVDTRAHPF